MSEQISETPQEAANFLNQVFASSGLDLDVNLRSGIAGPVLDIDGRDAELLQSQTGELLEAVQHLVNQVYGRNLAGKERLVCDVRGFRATREAELQAMANHAANRVRQSGLAFTFEPMSANERRIIHLTLADSEDLITESIGEGYERKLRVSRKSPAK